VLLEKGELTVNEISSILNRQMSTISRNLRILEKNNFVKARHTSKNVFYSIKKDEKSQKMTLSHLPKCTNIEKT